MHQLHTGTCCLALVFADHCIICFRAMYLIVSIFYFITKCCTTTTIPIQYYIHIHTTITIQQSPSCSTTTTQKSTFLLCLARMLHS